MRISLGYLRYLSAIIFILFLSTSCDQPGIVQSSPTSKVGPTLTMTSSDLLSTIAQKWKIKPGNHMDTSPAIVGGVIYATLEDTCICAFDAETGQTIWQVPPPGLGLTSPVVANGIVFVGMHGDLQIEPEMSETSYLYAFDARTGDGKWRYEGDSAEDEGASVPVVADNIVYMGTGHADGTGITPPAGMVSALDANTGRLVWQIKTSGSESGGVTVGDGMVFFDDGYDYNFQADRLHAVDAETGEEKWIKDFSPQLPSMPLVYDKQLYMGGDGKLVVLDAQTGQEKWHTSLPADSFSSPLIEDGTLYFASNQHRVFCIDNCPPSHNTDYISSIDASTGVEKWRVTLNDGGGPLNDLALYNAVLYYNTFRPNYLKALDAETGKLKWQFEADDAIFGTPAVMGDVIYLGVSDGTIYALLPPGSPTSALTPRPAQTASPVADSTPIMPAANVQEAPARGFRAPDFTLTEVNTNKQVTLSALRGKPVFLNFWATWCPPCKEEMPRIENLYATYKDEVEFISIASSSSDDLQKITSFIHEGGFSWSFLHDPTGEIGSKYQAVSYPTSFFIDKGGLIHAIHIGEMEQADMESNLRAIR